MNIMKKKPNIILFITHDQGQFLGCYDTFLAPNQLRTPNLDEVAKKGVRFTNHYCTAPQCSPSRGSIQTSLYPHQNGLMGLVNLGWTMPEENKTLPMYLKENGYTTHLLGLQHETLDAKTLGYDTISKRGPEFKYSRGRMEKEYLKFLTEHKDDDKPFYLNIGTIEVHRPYKAWSEAVDPERVRIPPYLPENDEVRQDFAEFYGNIEIVDETIGKLIDHLESIGILENTLFIYTTDHGIPFPRAKCTLYDPGLLTLMIMYQKNSDLFSGGKIVDGMVSNIDLLPSLLDYIGGEIPKDIEGVSFLPLLNEEKEEVRSEIFAEKTFHEIYDPMRGIRTRRFKYIRNFKSLDRLYQIPRDIFIDGTGQVMKSMDEEERPMEELYDLEKDQLERNNILKDASYQEVLNDLRSRLEKWMERTNDPLLEGKVEDKRQEVKEHY
ncbi:MAG: sulfatase-like hydrolase/transferase [Candidatus Lokiarchaeota archaeon]|nr:sulfatase-like hydrolase/transferase [Candidatus Lokiarchaeota archaeon]MBD3339226.1 sulfatase-like hydrolase/transferase [Candidatus Lokiarchaeota archaeon]